MRGIAILEFITYFTLNVVPAPTLTLSASNNNFCAGDSTILTATLNGGTGTSIYQWQQYIGTTWNNIVGATGETYSTPPFSANTNYKVISSQTGAGCITSGPNTLNITINPLPNIYTNSYTATLLNGNSVLWKPLVFKCLKQYSILQP